MVLLAATAAAQTYVNGGRTIEGPVNFCVDTGSSDSYACSLNPAITGYTAGAIYSFRANAANTGDATINFNGLGAKTIRKNRDQALADNDIKAGQLVTVMYDGAEMQMQSQTGNAAVSGGGGTAPNLITSPGIGYWLPFGSGIGAFITPNVIDRDLLLWQVVLPHKATFGKVGINVATASGTACPGGTCGLLVGMYDSNCTSLLTWGRVVSGGTPNINTTGPKWITLNNVVTLDPGVYYMALSTDSGVLTVYARDIHAQLAAVMNSAFQRHGAGSNRSTGNGSTLTLPATCGTIGQAGFQLPPMIVWER
jgi:hypothetical protein